MQDISDNSPVILEIKLNRFKKGKGLWTFNNSLLGDKDYIELIKIRKYNR